MAGCFGISGNLLNRWYKHPAVSHVCPLYLVPELLEKIKKLTKRYVYRPN
jgi:hypothetical protein